MIPSVNFHLWEPCNMRCRFCFATFKDVKNTILPKGHLPKDEAMRVVEELAEIGFDKITFAGGEPTLCPWLNELIEVAKKAGMTTMIVTNGSKLSTQFLEKNKPFLDWIALSVDSLNEQTNTAIGRTINGSKLIESYYNMAEKIKQFGYGIKINTVVSSKNYTENLSEFIMYAKPKRWKILQVLPIKGQNDTHISEFVITDEQFNLFITNHKSLKEVTELVPETNAQILGSYAMVDPAGRFFSDSTGTHIYSKPITEIGARLAIQQVKIDTIKFGDRKGYYNWKSIN